MLVLGIESSCDDCSVAIVKDYTQIVTCKIASQIANHRPYYGVVPELASRLHTELILPTYKEVLEEAKINPQDIDAIAVTYTPGLIGSLLVGVCFAKSLSHFLNKPLIGVNHINAHLYAPLMSKSLEYPYIGLLVSGGHSLISIVKNPYELEIIGASVDDAIGEAFDKVAKFYDLGYPGGVVVDKLANVGDDSAYKFSQPILKSKYYRELDMSFSGLKSACINNPERYLKDENKKSIKNLCASFRLAAVKMVMNRVKKAIKQTGINRLALGGGVAANSLLRSQALALEKEGVEVSIPPMILCTDNAAMVAGLGCRAFDDKKFSPVTLSPASRVTQFKGYLHS